MIEGFFPFHSEGPIFFLYSYLLGYLWSAGIELSLEPKLAVINVDLGA